MKYKIKLVICLMLFGTGIYAQTINDILNSIVVNNKEIKATQQFWESKKVEYQTGILPENPKISYGHFPGNVTSMGTKVTFGASQSLDFPTVYFNKKNLSRLFINQADYQMHIVRQGILLESKSIYYELVYLNKLNTELAKRLKNAEELYNTYSFKMEKGETSIFEVNKAKLALVNYQNDSRLLESRKEIYNQKLSQLNGGIHLSVNDTIYSGPIIKDLEIILKDMAEKNPELKSFQAEKDIANGHLKLSKSLSLPKFELGYGSETLPEGSFRGVQFGVSIPLWEKTNTIKYSKANILFKEFHEESHRAEIISKTEQLYNKAITLQTNLYEYGRILRELNSIKLLYESLNIGHISLIEYFFEIQYFYDIYDKFLVLEKDYYQVLSELYRFEL